LSQRLDVGGIGHDHVRETAGHGLDHLRPVVDTEHFGASAGQFQSQGAAETAQADDHHGFGQVSQ
jgi:hypothetical protein